MMGRVTNMRSVYIPNDNHTLPFSFKSIITKVGSKQIIFPSSYYFNGGTSLTSFLPQVKSHSKRRRSLELFFFWSTQWPHNPIVLAIMKKPFNPSISNPRSLKTAPIIQSTFRIRLSFFAPVDGMMGAVLRDL